MRLTFTLVIVLVFSISSFSQAGTLIPGFGTGGSNIINLSPAQEVNNKVLVLSDGKILTGGIAYGSAGVSPKLALLRYNVDGTADGSFGSGGIAFSDIAGGVADMAVQADGKIVVITSAVNTSGAEYRAVVRFNSNGTIDPTFDGDGIAVLNAGSLRALVLQPDGKILVTGYRSNSLSQRDIYIARLLSNGSLDPGFGVNGELIKDFSPGDEANDILVQPDGKIVVGGQTGAAGNYNFIVLRLMPDGTMDTVFEGDGVAITSITLGSDVAYTLELQPDGRILAAGLSGNFIVGAIVRYNTDGSLDLSFSGDGIYTGPPNQVEYRDVKLQPDGKIVLGGFSFISSDLNSFLLRLNSNGTLDPSFGTGGVTIHSFSNSLDLFTSIALWGNRIYAVGPTSIITPGGENYAFLLAAFQNDVSTFATAPYVLNGSAMPIAPLSQGNYCFLLTPPLLYQAGSVWNSNQLNLNQSFEITTKMYFGAADNGADGIAFVLQQSGTNALGLAGGGLGYANIPGHSFIIEFDTYQNTASWYDMSDPTADHLGFMSNGSANHNPSGGTVLQAPILLSNIENGLWNDVVFRWNAVTKTMTVTLMGNTYTYTGDIVNTIFGGNSMVYFGFTAGTGSPLQGVTPSQQSVCILSATANLQGRAAMDPQLITRVQPNPSNGQFELQFNDDIEGRAELFISNSNGVIVERRSVNVTGTSRLEQFNLRNLPPGLYFIRVVSAKGTQTQKLILR